MTPQPILLPLSKLVASRANVRRVKTDLAPLVASLRADGILQNLVVVPRERGRYEVVAGERRRQAAACLVKAGEWPRDVRIPCEVRPAADAVAVSIAENAERVAMHPADAYRAFAALEAGGHDPVAIAHRFGYPAAEVEKMLRLGRLIPDALKALADDRIDVAFAQALTLTDDPELQRSVLKRAGSASEARRLLTQTKLSASHRLYRFVADDYEAAGGTLTADLFGRERYADDPALVQNLVEARLEALAAAARAEGWGEVIAAQTEPDEAYRLERLLPESVREPTIEEAAALDAARAAVAHAEAGEGGQSPADLWDARRQIGVIERECRVFTPEQKAEGVLVLTVDYEGGLRRTPHRRPVAARSEADAPRERPLYAAALVEDLSRCRTRALQLELARRPALALDVLLDALLGLACPGRHALQLRAEAFRLEGGEALATMPTDAPETLVPDLAPAVPAEPAARWAWLQTLGDPDKARLLAVATAGLVNGIEGRIAEPARQASFERVAQAAALDMATHWRPSVAFFERLTKRACLEALEAGVGHASAENCARLGKAELARACAERLAATNWLPAPLRAPAEMEAPGAVQPAAA